MCFELPESYRAYCSDVAVRTAVDHILSADSGAPLTLPADIEWKELPAFHRAVLSAHQVRCEFAMSLIELWDAVWKPALDEWELGGDLQPLSVADAQHWHGTKLDTNTVWDEGWFGRGFEIGCTSLLLLPAVVVDTEQVQLLLCLWGKDDTDQTTGLDLGNDWPEQCIEEGTARTRKSLAPIQDNGTIDCGPVHNAVKDALTAVGNRVRG